MLVIVGLGFMTRVEVVMTSLFVAMVMSMAFLPRGVRVLMRMPVRVSVAVCVRMFMDMSDIPV
jgi:hypothetical protein